MPRTKYTRGVFVSDPNILMNMKAKHIDGKTVDSTLMTLKRWKKECKKHRKQVDNNPTRLFKSTSEANTI